MERALAELSSRRRRAEAEAEHRTGRIERAIPEISALRRELAQTGIRLSRIVLGGGDTAKAVAGLQALNLRHQAELSRLLRAHGFTPEELEPHYACPLCSDRGYVNGKRCECLKHLLADMAAEQLNAVSPMALCTFDAFSLTYYPDTPDSATGLIPRVKMGEVLEYCKEYASGFTPRARSLFMLGKTGLGKTHLSLAIAKAALEKSYRVIYGSAQDLLREVEREHFGRSGDGNGEALSTLLTAELLIIDDLGAEYESSFNLATLYNLINTRLSKGIPTIINSNLSLPELQKRYADRIVSRLLAMYDYLRFIGSDIRQLKMMKAK